ncbi:MAG: HD domain-containing protein [Patescibacteria group bacterium]|jgi:hypothetical protein
MKPLIINHKIYGRFIITEPVLIELIKSPALQRLKGVGQNGAHDFHYTSPGPFTRFQHSIGVMLLLRKFNAPLTEQVAGLLHDVSHTAFSHVADFVFNSHTTQSYQDTKLAQALEIQGINKILTKHHIKPKEILAQENLPLLEKKLPDLCADRLDYTLQEPTLKKLKMTDPKYLLENLTVWHNQFIFKNKKSAKIFAALYLKMNQVLWCNPLEATIYQVLADIIKLGLEKKLIQKKDLFTTDQLVLTKLKKDPILAQKIIKLKTIRAKVVPKSQAELHIYSKTRVVDPYFMKNNKLVRLSMVDKGYNKQTGAWLKTAKKGFYIKILNS